MVTSTQPLPETQPTSAEDEALKRNTDCVYFLASPLTCKKGSECEYRHSDYARVNPRDCYYWLNGNCLNPKCGFRHPPLDGLYGNQAAGSALPPPQTATLPSVHNSYNSGKQPVPCIFFQKGFCMKGDKCAFLHGPNPANNKVSLPTTSSNSMEPSLVKKAFGSLQKCTQEQKVASANMSKTAEPNAKAVKKAEFSSRNGVGIERDVQQSKSIDVPRHKTTTIPTVFNGNTGRSNPLHQPQIAEDNGFHNDKDADDHLRDSSPGFDVLVDDEEGEAEYYHGEDQYERAIGHEGRNSRSVDNYDMGHSADYNSMTDADQETYNDPRGYDSYERMQGYAWEQRRVSSDRMRVGAAHIDRGGYPISDSPERIEESELRYRLSKQKRGNGLRSVVSHDFVQDNQAEDRGQLRSHRVASHGSSISSRLRGRIELPGRSPNDGGDPRAEREMNRGRIWGRLSPGRTHTGRIRDRIKGRLEEDYNPEGRNLKGHRIRREIIDDRNTDFAGPKSLAELRDGKHVEVGSQHILGKRKQSESQQPEDLSFEAPLSLSEILKRKREADGAPFGSGSQPTSKDDDNLKASFSSSSNGQAPGANSSHPKDENNNVAPEGKKESNSALTETDEVENVDVADDESLQQTLNEYGTEDGLIGDDGTEYNEYEGDEQRDGDFEYEQDYDGEYNYEEGENAEAEEEYIDDEEGDDFAKKIGAVLS